MEHHRGEVADALVKGFGGESALYESLSKSKESLGEDEEDEFDEDLYEGSAQQGRAYGWITNGCPRLH